ncbi:MAG: hypothetical protein KGZ83_13910 [Sulfuricella sp.]|nr:hypothetical protein [Sulfuricella sp.]
MPLIHTVAPSQAHGQVAEVYRQAEAILGRVPNAFQMYSGSPALLETQWQQTAYFMRHPTLSFPLLAFTRLLVSQDHRCDYCIDFNAAMLVERAGLPPEQIAAVKRDPTTAPLEARDKAMLLFALKASRTPHEVTAADIDALKSLGWAESDILDAVAHAARNMAADIVFNTFKIVRDE